MQSFLKLRPLFHTEERRVRAHAFACVLCFLLEALMRKKLSMPVGRALRELKRMRVAMIDIEGEEVGLLPELDEWQVKILKELDVETPPRIV